ncbi:MAG: flagellar hook-length control protein FliK [Desulfobacteraceae bacterium]|nr:flagellar hook-length control protein FliK [Desulfobacteraceae bacterium]
MIQGVHIFSPELFKQQQGRGKAGAPLFVKDQVVDATVLKVLSATRAELMVAGNRVTADTSHLLVQGDTLQLKATGTGGFEILKPMASVHKPFQIPGPVLAALGSLTGQSPFAGLAKLVLPLLSIPSDGLDGPTIPGAADTSNTSMAEKPIVTAKGVLTPARLNHLRDLLFSLSLKSGDADTRFVPRLLEKSGLLWEKSLATLVKAEPAQSGEADLLAKDVPPSDFHRVRENDLKGFLLSLLSRAEPEEKEQLQPFREFVDAMEKFQVLNSHSSDSAKYLIPFPIFSSNSFSFGQLFFDLGGKKKESRPDAPRLVRVSVFLTMTNLGPLRVDLSVLDKDVSAMFQVEDEGVASFIKTMLPTLRKRLGTHGFQVLQVECRRGAPERISEASLVDRVVKDGSLSLDLVV